MEYSELRKQYPVFSFDGFSVNACDGGIRIEYIFTQSEDIVFKPYWVMPFDYNEYASDKAFIDGLIFNIGMSELVSYWKACCSPTVIIRCGGLCDKQVAFWKKLYFNGLGEFFYRNSIDTDINGFMDIKADKPQFAKQSKKDFCGNLIPVGGGKDSIVTMELLSSHRDENSVYIIDPNGSRLDSAKTAGYTGEKVIAVNRYIDRSIVDLNNAGYLNGHTPLSAVIAFSAFLCAYMRGIKNIVLSNESSANESYVYGKSVNHQYSKSFEFENDFREYADKYLSHDINYYSLLRPLNEWNIVKHFVKYPQYHGIFRSCNLGSKANVWCGKCSKCLFTCIMLSPFIEKSALDEIFGNDLLNDENMLKFLDGLVSEKADKPFECIGTRTEINAALTSAYIKNKDNLPLILRAYYEKYGLDEKSILAADNYFDRENNVPECILKELGWNRI